MRGRRGGFCLVSKVTKQDSSSLRTQWKSQRQRPALLFSSCGFAQRRVDWDMVMDQDTQWLYQLLAEVQLEKFYLRVRDGLNITRLEHFAYVKESDLEQIGISKPGEGTPPFSSVSVFHLKVRHGMTPVCSFPSSKAIMGCSETAESEIPLMDSEGLNPGLNPSRCHVTER